MEKLGVFRVVTLLEMITFSWTVPENLADMKNVAFFPRKVYYHDT